MAGLIVTAILFVISIIVAIVNAGRKKEWKRKLAAPDQFRVTVPRDEVISRFAKAEWIGNSTKKIGMSPLKNHGVATASGLLLEWRALIGKKVTDVNITISEDAVSTLISIEYSYRKGNNDTLNQMINQFETEVRYMFRDVLADRAAS